MKLSRKNLAYLATGFITVVTSVSFVFSPTVAPVSGADWQAGRIIDDPVFTNKSAMSPSEIQTFLNNMMPSCDNSGSKSITYHYNSSTGAIGNPSDPTVTTTRAVYGSRKGNPAPFTCLKDYYENPTTKANNYGGKAIPSGAESAAQLIWDAAQQYNINPQVLVVTLQKEQGLITDDWPFLNEYLYAMGAHCPDGPNGAQCDSNYAGFGIQMSESARLFRYYLDNMGQSWWPYAKPFANNSILYNTTYTNCGSSNVFIQDNATAALYTYTPYQPNQAALDNLYGTGDDCSAYGNRNFWRNFNDWFGPSLQSNNSGITITQLSISAPRVIIGGSSTISYSLKNTLGTSQTLSSFGIACRFGNTNCDFGVQKQVTFAAGETKSFTATYTPPALGNYDLWLTYQGSNGGWNNSGTYLLRAQTPNLAVITPIRPNPTFPVDNQSTTMSFTIENLEGTAITLPSVVIAERTGGTNTDYTAAQNVTIQPNTNYTYTTTRTFTNTSTHDSWIAYSLDNMWFRLGDDYVFRAYSTPASVTVKTAPQISVKYPLIDQNVGATFTIINSGDQPVDYTHLGIMLRDASNNNVDFNGRPNGTNTLLAGNSTYTYHGSQYFPVAGQVSGTVIASTDGQTFTAIPSGAATNGLSFTVYSTPANVTVTTPLHLTPASPVQGSPAMLTFTLSNTGAQPMDINSLAVYCRVNNANCDFPPEKNLTLTGGQQYTYTESTVLSSAGSYDLRPMYQATPGGIWVFLPNSGATIFSLTSYNPPASSFAASLTPSVSTPSIGELVTVQLSLTNNTPYTLNFAALGVGARYFGRNIDFGVSKNVPFAAGEQKTFNVSFRPPDGGPTTLFPTFSINGQWYNFTSTTVTAHLPQILVTNALGFSPATPSAGGSVTGSFTIKNIDSEPLYLPVVGIGVRTSHNTNADFLPSTVTIAPGNTYTFSGSKSFSAGSYSATPIYQLFNNNWYSLASPTTLTVTP